MSHSGVLSVSTAVPIICPMVTKPEPDSDSLWPTRRQASGKPEARRRTDQWKVTDALLTVRVPEQKNPPDTRLPVYGPPE